MWSKENLIDLERLLRSGHFRAVKYYSFYIDKPKRRQIFTISYEGRIILYCFYANILVSEIDNCLIYENGACRKGKGAYFSIKPLRKYFNDDYRKFGSCGYLLIDKLAGVFAGDILHFIKIIISSYYHRPGVSLPLEIKAVGC